jgi:hypothetical protein
VAVQVKHVVLQMLILVTRHLFGSVVQEIGDFHRFQEVQKEVSIVTTKCGTLQQVQEHLEGQDDQETGVLVTLPTLAHASTV